jgi:hypothetical protein
MIESDFIKKYGLTIGMLLVASYVGSQIKSKLNIENTDEDEHKLIKEYILNDSPLYGYNKPKLWIHSIYEINSRNWESFQSRNNNELNQPYLNYTIQSLINKCNKDFHICLIDDKSFNKLIPGFDKNVNNMPEPLKSQYREIAMLELIYLYGGMIVPNSFLCMSNLKKLYDQLVELKKPFVFEKVNNYCNMKKGKKMDYVPDINMMGSVKNSPVIYSLLRSLKIEIDKGHISGENEFLGRTSHIINKYINEEDIAIVNGYAIGIKDKHDKPIELEDLFSYNKKIEFSDKLYGINLPRKEILSRNKYNWLAALNEEDVLKSNINIVKYIKVSQVSDYFEKKSIIPTFF